ncbi:MAG: alkaline phosphatase family protein [Nocardioidaceae bacterium]
MRSVSGSPPTVNAQVGDTPQAALVTTVGPRYGTWSLADLIPSAIAALDVPGWSNPLGLPTVDSCVVFLIDGLGWRLLLDNADEAPYLSSLIAGTRPLTTGVPSTTATSLTCLGTGLSPGAHGVVGATCRIPGTERLLNALHWETTKVDPWEWQAHETAFGRAAKAGLAVSVVSKREFARSGLTQASQRGASFVGADSIGERIFATARAAAQPLSLTYLYDGDLDGTGHRSGSASWAWRYQLAMVDSFAATLRDALPEDTSLIVTGDHGMVDVDSTSRIDVDHEAGLMEGVNLFGGEARFRHLYCDSGAVQGVSARWRERLGDAGVVRTRDEAIAEGWFGPVDPQVRPRLGDVMVACLGTVAVVSSERFPREAKLVGMHGSLTPNEMLVPLLVDPAR